MQSELTNSNKIKTTTQHKQSIKNQICINKQHNKEIPKAKFKPNQYAKQHKQTTSTKLSNPPATKQHKQQIANKIKENPQTNNQPTKTPLTHQNPNSNQPQKRYT